MTLSGECVRCSWENADTVTCEASKKSVFPFPANAMKKKKTTTMTTMSPKKLLLLFFMARLCGTCTRTSSVLQEYLKVLGFAQDIDVDADADASS